MTPRNVVLEGDALMVLRTLAEASVDAVMTSPPYFRARRYQAGPAELGQEVDVDTWAQNLRAVSREIARVLVSTGSYWLNLGDVYSRNLKLGAPPKSLLLGPERLIRGLLADGWLVRDRVAWVQDDAAAVTGDRSVDDRLGVRLAPGAPAELLLRPRCHPGAPCDTAKPWSGPPL
jgi:site-specific DNA-methyltransferase (adenine-specific)